MNRLKCGACWAYAAASLAGCDSDFVPYNELEGTRVLAIAAEPPELVPGNSARLSALVTDATSYRWRWCPVTLGAASGHACALEAPLLSTSTTAIIDWPADPSAICSAAASARAPQDSLRLDCTALRPTIAIELEVEGSGGKVSAIWPLVIGRPDQAPNRNPAIAEVRAADAPLVDGSLYSAGQVVPLEAVAAAPLPEGAESLKVTWFVAGGGLDRVRTSYDPELGSLGNNVWSLPATGDSAALHLVVRDDRGGVSWLSRSVRLEGGAQ